MLKDSLSNLLDSTNKSKECKMGKLIKSLDKETATVFKEAMSGDTSTMDLMKALRSEGHSFCREFLANKRNCFKDINSLNSCCVSETIKNINNQKEKGSSK